MIQDRIFKKGEGDNWFTRNKEALKAANIKNDIIVRMMDYLGIRPRKILEIGCANGYRLHYLKTKYRCDCTGIDCSKAAIEDGIKRFAGIRLVCCGADKLGFNNSAFDIVIINFVFHWIDRSLLSRVALEADRVLKDKGLVIIGDFYPRRPMKVRYYHLKGGRVFTYKDDYSLMFERLGYYQNVGRVVSECGTKKIGTDVEYDKRSKTDVLIKDLARKRRGKS